MELSILLDEDVKSYLSKLCIFFFMQKYITYFAYDLYNVAKQWHVLWMIDFILPLFVNCSMETNYFFNKITVIC